MRVLFVTNIWPDEQRPAYGSFIKTQADSLVDLGIDLDVMPIRGYVSPARYISAGVKLLASNRRRVYDVVHAHYGHSGVVARMHVRTPLIVSYCGADLLGDPDPTGVPTRKSVAEAAVFRQLARVATATITKSSAMADCLPARCRARNHVIPNGVDLSAFCSLSREEARRRLGWPEDEVAVLFVGNPNYPRKNHKLAAGVVERVGSDVGSVRLRVAWNIPPAAIPTWMSAADVLLFTSRSEGSPNVVKEAMAAELPIVSTPVGDVEERIGGLSGCSVERPDVDALAGAVLKAVSHGRVPDARHAVASLSLEAVGRRILAVYRDVCAGHSRPFKVGGK